MASKEKTQLTNKEDDANIVQEDKSSANQKPAGNEADMARDEEYTANREEDNDTNSVGITKSER
jgi:hypothetical protein